MGTSRNMRSPSELRWRVVAAAYETGSTPRAVSELFRAADRDGWLQSLASPTCAAYAAAAAAAPETLPLLLRDSPSPSWAIRSLVDGARRTALDTAEFPVVGLITGLAERGLTRVLVSRTHATGTTVSTMTTQSAAQLWSGRPIAAATLATDFLVETIRQVVLHLVHRDGPQLVGGTVGGASDVSALARGLADTAAGLAQVAAPVMVERGLAGWPAAADAAWTASRELVNLGGGQAKGRFSQ